MDTMNSPVAPSSPGMTAEEMAMAFADLPAPPLVEAAPTAKPSAAVRWLTDKKRVDSYELVYPFAIGDVEVRTITVKRLSAGAVAAFTAKLRALPDDALNPRFPMFYLGDLEISDEIWDAMDDDDRVALAEVSQDFLPARFRP